MPYRCTVNVDEFASHPGEKISYSKFRNTSGFFIKSSPLLFENNITTQEIEIVEKHQTKVFFANEDDDLGFDIFSAVFYMVSRYEEYLPFPQDEFGRFRASSSLAFQNNFLQKPVVDIWINSFRDLLMEKFPSLKLKSREFDAIFTYDIDVAYKFKGRSLGRVIGGSLKDLAKFKFRNIINRNSTLLKRQKDPWDVYDGLKDGILKNKLNTIFFFLLADKTKHDRNLDYKSPTMKSLIAEISVYSNTGIHPSFYSSDFPEKISIEKARLEDLSGEKIKKSRQHFLRFRLSETYNALLAAGITEDYSMGYPGAAGFRAGTCKPFYFYDLKNEEMTDLKIFPVACMDATFVYYSKKSPEKALVEILGLIKEIKKVGGIFIPIFHNDHIGDNQKWQMVHDKIIIQVKSYLKK
ncbi:MAG TPA: polysaccharide deacetylase family protein [Hanamia sp.]